MGQYTRGYDSQVTYVVQELSTRVALNVMSIEVTPTQLYINPELVARSAVENIFALEGRSGTSYTRRRKAKRTSVTSDGRAIFHLYAENRRISAQEEFIL